MYIDVKKLPELRAALEKNYCSRRCPITEYMSIDVDPDEFAELMDLQAGYLKGDESRIAGFRDAVQWFDDFIETVRGRLLVMAVSAARNADILSDRDAAAFAYTYRNLMS